MKIVITADIHNGVPNKTKDCIWSMKVIRDYAESNSIDTVLVLGDLFHDRSSLSIDVLYQTYRFFEETERDFNQTWMCFPGNHDMFLKNSWEINSLVPLNRLMTIIEDICTIRLDGARFWILPFIHYESAYMSVANKIEKKYEAGDILLTHIGVNGSTLNECFLLKNWNIVSFKDSPFDRIYSGHFHCHQQVGENLWYPGSPIPFRFDEGFVEHGFLVYDTELRTHEFISTFEISDGDKPPDYITVTDSDLADVGFAESNRVRVVIDKEYTEHDLNKIRQRLTENGAVSVAFVKPKEKIEEFESSTSAVSIKQAFTSWVKHDKPKGLNEDLLTTLNEQVQAEAEERISVEAIDD